MKFSMSLSVMLNEVTPALPALMISSAASTALLPRDLAISSSRLPIRPRSTPPRINNDCAPPRDQFSARGVEHDHSQLRRGRVHQAVNGDRIALRLGAWNFIARIEPPRDFESMDVIAGDLIQRRIVNVVWPAAEHPPLAVLPVESFFGFPVALRTRGVNEQAGVHCQRDCDSEFQP